VPGNSQQNEENGVKRFDAKFWIGIGISAFFMVLLFRKLDLSKLASTLKQMDLRYIAVAVSLTFVSYYLRALRWKFLLLPVKSCRMRHLYPATIIGYMANNILPARLGEFIRAYVLAEKEGIPSAPVFATLVIDRLFDGFAVILMLVVTLFVMTFPADMQTVATGLRTGGAMMLVTYLLIVAFLVLLKLQTVRAIKLLEVLMKPFPRSWGEKLIPLLGSFISGIRLSRNMSHLGSIVILTLLIWTSATIPIGLVFESIHISLPPAASLFIMVLLVFAVMVPASPGFIGTYHYACYKGLSVFNIVDAQAMGIALVLHGIAFFPVIFAGMYHLWKDKISLNTAAGKETTGESV